MHKKSMFILILLLLSCVVFAFKTQLAKAEPETWYVNDDGGADFTTIGEAVAAAQDGDTIFVYDGTYYEHLVITGTQELTVIGESKYGTIIDGSGFGSIIKIMYSEHVTICNFTMRSCGESAVHFLGAALCDINNNIVFDTYNFVSEDIQCAGNRVAGNSISNCNSGIFLFNSYNDQIAGNSISNCSFGIMLESPHSAQIIDNNISNISGEMSIYCGSPSNTQIIGNIISNMTGEVRYGIHFIGEGYNNTIIGNTVIGYCSYAIAIRHADQNLVADNTLVDSFYGIELALGACSNNVTRNILQGNGVGIRVADASNNNLVTENDVSDSIFVYPWISDIGIWIETSENTTVYHNSFVNNTAQTFIVAASGTVWDDGYPSGGNYWSDYTGVDANDDIIGDTPYIIDADNVDNYPFMNCRRSHPCDINGDRRVDIADVAAVSAAFGTHPSHYRWSSACDINRDSRVDIEDVALTSRKFGWHR